MLQTDWRTAIGVSIKMDTLRNSEWCRTSITRSTQDLIWPSTAQRF